MMWQFLTALIVSVFVYMAVGGLVFWKLESRSNEELPQVPLVNRELEDIISQIAKLAHGNDSCVEKSDLLDLLERLQNTTSRDFAAAESPWDLPASIFFAMTIVTTIGYGNLVPTTSGGQVFCCIYSLLGIPLCLVMLSNIGVQLNDASRRLDERINKRRPRMGKYCRSGLIVICWTVIFILIPSAVFSYLQNWSYGTALYFSVISLTTIGFGDYVAGINYRGPTSAIYRLLVGLWIFFGLAWLAGIVSSLHESLLAMSEQVKDKSISEFIRSKEKEIFLSKRSSSIDPYKIEKPTDDTLEDTENTTNALSLQRV